MIKSRTLRCGDYAGLLWWAQCNYTSLCERGKRIRKKVTMEVEVRVIPGRYTKERRQPLDAGKGRKNVSPFEPAEGMQC